MSAGIMTKSSGMSGDTNPFSTDNEVTLDLSKISPFYNYSTANQGGLFSYGDSTIPENDVTGTAGLLGDGQGSYGWVTGSDGSKMGLSKDAFQSIKGAGGAGGLSYGTAAGLGEGYMYKGYDPQGNQLVSSDLELFEPGTVSTAVELGKGGLPNTIYEGTNEGATEGMTGFEMGQLGLGLGSLVASWDAQKNAEATAKKQYELDKELLDVTKADLGAKRENGVMTTKKGRVSNDMSKAFGGKEKNV